MIFKLGLYIVSTPIGNLDDITVQALETLKNSTIILCEDTRISRKLLAKHNIKTKLRVYNDHSDYQEREVICTLIYNGLKTQDKKKKNLFPILHLLSSNLHVVLHIIKIDIHRFFVTNS